MGQLIRVDFTTHRRLTTTPSTEDPVSIARKIRGSIKKAQLSPRMKISVRTQRSPRRLDRIYVEVTEFDGQIYNPAWLDWSINPETKHTRRPEALPTYTAEITACWDIIDLIVNKYPGLYEPVFQVDPVLYASELAHRQRTRTYVKLMLEGG